MLLRVQDYYRRYPDAEGRSKPYFARLIELPPEQLPAAVGGEQDREVVEYLRHHSFSLGPRLAFVTQKVAQLQGSVGAVSCPRCQTGRLHVPPENWDEFTAGDASTWYWPHWHAFDADGTLRVKASGYRGGSHWTGELAISPAEPDYDFWCWLVAQKEYHRLVAVSELPDIQEDWLRRTRQGL